MTYQITGTLARSATFGVDVEPHVAAVGFDGGRFRATVTLDDSVADVDASGTRAVYAGAVTASTLVVAGTVFGHDGYCNLDPNILDCSVEALNDHPLAPGLVQDGWRLNSQVYRPAAVPGLPAGFISFMTFDLAAIGSAGPGPVGLFDSTALDFGLDRLGADLPGVFGLDLRGYNPDNIREEFGVFWTATDLQVSLVSDVPEPASAALALLALRRQPARRRRGAAAGLCGGLDGRCLGRSSGGLRPTGLDDDRRAAVATTAAVTAGAASAIALAAISPNCCVSEVHHCIGSGTGPAGASAGRGGCGRRCGVPVRPPARARAS